MGKTFEKKLADEFVGKPCVIRSANAGVFIGIPTAITVKGGSGHLVATFEEVRRAWRWEVVRWVLELVSNEVACLTDSLLCGSTLRTVVLMLHVRHHSHRLAPYQ
jgi:hypothetical protein